MSARARSLQPIPPAFPFISSAPIVFPGKLRHCVNLGVAGRCEARSAHACDSPWDTCNCPGESLRIYLGRITACRSVPHHSPLVICETTCDCTVPLGKQCSPLRRWVQNSSRRTRRRCCRGEIAVWLSKYRWGAINRHVFPSDNRPQKSLGPFAFSAIWG